MQVNVISQVLLSLALLPVLQRTPNSRLVHQSSDLHRGISSSTVHFASLDELNTDIGAAQLYNRSKLAQILFIRALAKHARNGELGFDDAAAKGPWINATHPGGVKTDQQKQAVDAYGTLGKVGVAAVRPFMKDPVDEGCRPALFAVTSEDVVKEQIQGQYVS
jgi:WW domain-containing oxidoreductase